ncbi:MAG: hypothetical protein ACLRPQ_02925 [Streptococcus sp.]
MVDKCYHGFTLNFLVVGQSHVYLGKLQKPLPGEEVVENFDDDDLTII